MVGGLYFLYSPLASEDSCEVLMADGEIMMTKICTLPFKPEHFIVDGPLIEEPGAETDTVRVLNG